MYIPSQRPAVHTRPGSGLGIYGPYDFALPSGGDGSACGDACTCGGAVGMGQSILDDLGLGTDDTADDSTGSSSSLVTLLLVAAAGGAYWYFARQKKIEKLDKQISSAQSRLTRLRAERKS
jgi:hypothetical protein